MSDVPILAITAEHDGQTTETLHTLFTMSTSEDSRLMLYKGGEHGWPLFEQDPSLEGAIVDWYRRHLE